MIKLDYTQKQEEDADATPEKQGHWQRSEGHIRLTECGFVRMTLCTCSECRWSCNCEEELGFEYCPNCGAKMEEEE